MFYTPETNFKKWLYFKGNLRNLASTPGKWSKQLLSNDISYILQYNREQMSEKWSFFHITNILSVNTFMTYFLSLFFLILFPPTHFIAPLILWVIALRAHEDKVSIIFIAEKSCQSTGTCLPVQRKQQNVIIYACHQNILMENRIKLMLKNHNKEVMMPWSWNPEDFILFGKLH